MRAHHKLSLRKEQLLELGRDELSRVAGGTEPSERVRCLDPTDPSDWLAACDSYLRPCITHTCH